VVSCFLLFGDDLTKKILSGQLLIGQIRTYLNASANGLHTIGRKPSVFYVWQTCMAMIPGIFIQIY
jgi:hypothetical protein